MAISRKSTFRYGLRTVAILLSISALCFALLRSKVNQLKRDSAILSEIGLAAPKTVPSINGGERTKLTLALPFADPQNPENVGMFAVTMDPLPRWLMVPARVFDDLPDYRVTMLQIHASWANDSTLKMLSGLSSLESLEFHGSEVTHEAIESFRTTYPKTRIAVDGSGNSKSISR